MTKYSHFENEIVWHLILLRLPHICVFRQLKSGSVWSISAQCSWVYENHKLTVSPWSPTAARSPSSLWLQLSVSPPTGVWRLSLRQCLSVSGWVSHLSIVWRIKERNTVCYWEQHFLSESLVTWYVRLLRLETGSNFSPSGFVVQLVFQLPHFLLNDAQPLSVYEDCVLLEHTRITFIYVLIDLFIANLFDLVVITQCDK